jgi:hypothetical protein
MTRLSMRGIRDPIPRRIGYAMLEHLEEASINTSCYGLKLTSATYVQEAFVLCQPNLPCIAYPILMRAISTFTFRVRLIGLRTSQVVRRVRRHFDTHFAQPEGRGSLSFPDAIRFTVTHSCCLAVQQRRF